MPPRIDLNKCNGCGGKPETACEMVCPGDLMMLDPETGKARCRATGECWDCMSCIKVCPTGAKYLDDPAFLSHVAMLEQNYTRPTQAEWFL